MLKVSLKFKDGNTDLLEVSTENIAIIDYNFFGAFTETALSTVCIKYGWDCENIVGINIELV